MFSGVRKLTPEQRLLFCSFKHSGMSLSLNRPLSRDIKQYKTPMHVTHSIFWRRLQLKGEEKMESAPFGNGGNAFPTQCLPVQSNHKFGLMSCGV